MADQWKTVVEDEALEDPLILPADGLEGDNRSEGDEARADDACAREDDLLAKDAARDLAADQAPRGRARRAASVSSRRARRTTGG